MNVCLCYLTDLLIFVQPKLPAFIKADSQNNAEV